jgi:DNA-binding SARP family transcriptional activator
MDQPWRIQMFGGLRGERVITRFRTQKNGALFAYFAYYCERAHAREVLIELFWPGREPAAGRNSLSTALSSLRYQFEPPGVPGGTLIQADRFFVQLNPAAVTTDVADLEQALQSAAVAASDTERAQSLMEAVELYRGELLPGFYFDWVVTEQRRLVGPNAIPGLRAP